jgi:hypothetical protein
MKRWLAILFIAATPLQALAAESLECGDGSRAWVDVSAHELTARTKDGVAVSRELPVCAFLKIHTNKCVLGLFCYGSDRKVKIPVRFDSTTYTYETEAARIPLKKKWTPVNADCWELADYEIYELNIGSRSTPDLDGGRVYVTAGDPGVSRTVVLDSSRDDVFHVCQ